MGLRRSIVTSVIVFAFTGLFSLLGMPQTVANRLPMCVHLMKKAILYGRIPPSKERPTLRFWTRGTTSTMSQSDIQPGASLC